MKAVISVSAQYIIHVYDWKETSWNSLKSWYLLLDRKSHTKSKIARKGYKTSRFASQRGRRKGAREPGRWGWGGAGKRQRVCTQTHISSFFWKVQRSHYRRIYCPTPKTRFKNNAGAQRSPLVRNVRVIPYIVWAAARSRAVAAHYYTNRYPAAGGRPRLCLPPPGGQVLLLSPQKLSRQ